MFTYIHSVDWILWVAGLFVEVGCIAAILTKNRAQIAMLAYLLFSVMRSGVLLVIATTSSYDSYFYAYWILQGLGVPLQFAVAYSVYRQLFDPYKYHLGRLRAHVAFIATFFIAFVIATNAANHASTGNVIMDVVRTFDRAAALSIGAAYLVIIGFSEALCLPQNRPVFGIVTGWSFYIAVHGFRASILAALHITEGTRQSDVLAYIVAAGIWWWYLSSPEPERPKISLREVKIMLELARVWRKRVEERSF